MDEFLGEIILTLIALGLTVLIREAKKALRAEVEKRELYTEQADLIFDVTEKELDLVSKRFPNNDSVTLARKKFRKLREDFWEDEEATTEDLKELIKGW